MTNTTITTRKPRTTTTKTKVDTPTVEEVVQETVEAKEPVVEKRVLDNNTEITVMNNNTGRHLYKSKNGYQIDLEEYGDTQEVPFGELKTMYNSAKRHLSDAFLIILDEDAVKALPGLSKQYERILAPHAVDELLKDPELIKELLPKMVQNMQAVVIATARNQFKNGELKDISVAKAIKEAIKVDVLG